MDSSGTSDDPTLPVAPVTSTWFTSNALPLVVATRYVLTSTPTVTEMGALVLSQETCCGVANRRSGDPI